MNDWGLVMRHTIRLCSDGASQAELKRRITFVEQELQVSKRSCAPRPSFDLKGQSIQSIVGRSYPLKSIVYESIVTSMHPS
jgi:hypothetical protein